VHANGTADCRFVVVERGPRFYKMAGSGVVERCPEFLKND